MKNQRNEIDKNKENLQQHIINDNLQNIMLQPASSFMRQEMHMILLVVGGYDTRTRL